MRKIIAKMRIRRHPLTDMSYIYTKVIPVLGWVVGSWKKNVDHHMMNTIWKEGFKSGILFPNSYQEFKEAWEDGSYEIDGCRYYNENEFDVVQEGWEENMEDF